MKKSMRSTRHCMVVACLAGAYAVAHAGYLDERNRAPATPAATVPSQAAAGLSFALGPEFSSSVWQEAVAQPADAVTLGTALVMLWPLTLPALEIDMPSTLLERKVSWKAGETRQAILQRAAEQHQIQFRMAGRRISAASIAIPSAFGGAAAVAQRAPAAQRYEVQLGDIKLATAFERWAKTAGVRVRWDAERHVLIGAPMSYTGDISDAIAAALSSDSILQSDYPLEVCEYPNEPRLLRVTRLGEQAKACPVIAGAPAGAAGAAAAAFASQARGPSGVPGMPRGLGPLQPPPANAPN